MQRLFFYFLVLGLIGGAPAAQPVDLATFCAHAFSKVSELPYNWPARIHEILFRLDLMLKKQDTRRVFIPLSKLENVHPVTFPPALEKTKKRAESIRQNRSKVDIETGLSIEQAAEFMPSKNAMRAIRDKRGNFIVFDGNGRLEAIRQAFSDYPDLPVEVEVWTVSSNGVLSLLDRARRSNGALRY